MVFIVHEKNEVPTTFFVWKSGALNYALNTCLLSASMGFASTHHHLTRLCKKISQCVHAVHKNKHHMTALLVVCPHVRDQGSPVPPCIRAQLTLVGLLPRVPPLMGFQLGSVS